jgi:hypothetical protein
MRQLELPAPKPRPWFWKQYAQRLEVRVMDLQAQLRRKQNADQQ